MKMEEWKECKLEDLCDDLSDGLHKAPKFVENGEYIFVNAKNLSNGKIVDVDKQKHTTYDEYLKYKIDLNERTILYSIDGTIGNLAKYNNEKCVLGKGACYLNIKRDVSSDYIYYQLQTPHFKIYIHHLTTGSTIGHISLKTMRNYSFFLPPLPTQQKIAAILSSLDDKIELNNKINTNLEQQAQALFKNWFVDFEPFGGKMPEGWKVGKLCEIANYSSEKIEINKLTPETYYSTENMLPSKGGIETATSLPSISQTTRCLPGETIISNIRPYFKKIFYCTEEVAGCSTDVLCFKPKNKDYSEYLYQVLYSDIFFDYMVLGSKGTKMPRGDKQQIMNYPITIPDELYLRKFKTFAKRILSQIDSNRKENKRLSELRNTLLPKLMNGEIEVG